MPLWHGGYLISEHILQIFLSIYTAKNIYKIVTALNV